MIAQAQIVECFRSLIGRAPLPHELDQGEALVDLPALIAWLMQTPDYRAQADAGRLGARPLSERLGALEGRSLRPRPDPYLAPDDLAAAPWSPRRVLLIGACFIFEWRSHLRAAGISAKLDRVLFANAFRLPAEPPQPAERYDFAIVQVPLGSVCPELDHARLAYDDVAGHETLLDDSVARLALFLDEALAWSDRIPCFVLNYVLPQESLLGRLLPRYDLRNPAYFTERLNVELERLVRARRNVHLLDVDGIAATEGRRYAQEDAIWPFFHGGVNEDNDRILNADPSIAIADHYDVDVPRHVAALWRGACAAYRTLTGIDAIKMLCIDLDDTLWRGTLGDLDLISPVQIVGWPIGLAEALLYLKKRGIVLAIVSKNDEARVRAHWDTIFEGRLRLDDFAILKINWRPKPDNLADAMAEANLLPGNVAFLDDNPVEREAVRMAFPEIRTIDTTHHLWRRILGWSAELQVPAISDESARRTELIQARGDRERDRTTLSRGDFLASLALGVTVVPVRDAGDPRFARAFELVNKTNQFNTSGVRWSDGAARVYFRDGGTWWTFDVVDRFSRHGLVGVACLRDARIDQFVMSCRVAGLDIEFAALGAILAAAAPSGTVFAATIVPTDYNAVIAELYARLGWDGVDGIWRGAAPAVDAPHVEVTVAGPCAA